MRCIDVARLLAAPLGLTLVSGSPSGAVTNEKSLNCWNGAASAPKSL